MSTFYSGFSCLLLCVESFLDEIWCGESYDSLIVILESCSYASSSILILFPGFSSLLTYLASASNSSMLIYSENLSKSMILPALMLSVTKW